MQTTLILRYKKVAVNSLLSLVIAWAVLNGSCSSGTGTKAPRNILGAEEFTELLVDMALAESALALNLKNASGPRLDSLYAFDPLQERGIARSRYDSSLTYYTHNPEQYKEIYREVLRRLSELESARSGTKVDSVAQ